MITKLIWAFVMVWAATLSGCAHTGHAPAGYAPPKCAVPAAVSCTMYEPDAKRFGHASLI